MRVTRDYCFLFLCRTTWDEHIIELNLLQPVNLGHIDLKFVSASRCVQNYQDPVAIQVTLLKQNATGFGYRMKGSHMNFRHHLLDGNSGDSSFSGFDGWSFAPAFSFYILVKIQRDSFNSLGTSGNPVLNEEYLQTHNAEILVGPLELSSCMDMGERSGTVTLTSPKLFKTRTKNFLLHIKTMADPSKETANSKSGGGGSRGKFLFFATFNFPYRLLRERM